MPVTMKDISWGVLEKDGQSEQNTNEDQNSHEERGETHATVFNSY